jgi:hypothetical protein
MTNLSIPEPLPIPNNSQSIHDLVIEDLGDNHLVKDIRDRKQFGLDKYGTILQVCNNRNALKDAFQEVLDCIVYLKQACLESGNNGLEYEYFIAIHLADSLKDAIEKLS